MQLDVTQEDLLDSGVVIDVTQESTSESEGSDDSQENSEDTENFGDIISYEDFMENFQAPEAEINDNIPPLQLEHDLFDDYEQLDFNDNDANEQIQHGLDENHQENSH